MVFFFHVLFFAFILDPFCIWIYNVEYIESIVVRLSVKSKYLYWTQNGGPKNTVFQKKNDQDSFFSEQTWNLLLINRSSGMC